MITHERQILRRREQEANLAKGQTGEEEFETDDVMENGDGVLSLRRDSESEVLQGPFREERARNDVGFWFLRCNQPSLEVMRNSSRTWSVGNT